MTVRAVGLFEKWTGVNTTTPYEGGVSTSGGAVADGGTFTLPNVTKTTTNGVAMFRYGGRAAASGYTAWGVGSGWTGYTTGSSGATASPNLAEQVYAKGYETTPAAAGTITGPTITPTVGHALSSWAGRASVLRPSGGSAPVFVARTSINTQDSAGVLSITLTSQTNNAFYAVELELDDPTATLTMPDGTWVQAYSQTHTNGVLVGLYKFMPSSGTPSSATYNFTVSTSVSAPTNSTAPVISGTAAVGATLSTTNGTWTNSPTSYTYQWKHGGTSIPGATASTYTVSSLYAGETITCTVTATNTGGSASAASNGIAIPAAPVNTVAPAITTDGTPATAETITVSTGTWTGSGITYTYQWYRGSSPITGETTNSYTLAVTDEGANIRCDVTATNSGAPSGVTASSNVIVPAVTAPLSDDSFLTYYSGGTGNTDPALSLGGAKGGTQAGTVNDLFGPVIGSVAQAGGVFYRVIYVRNTHVSATAAAGSVFIESQFPDDSGLHLAVAVPAEGADVNVPALASGTTEPAGVTWSTATTAGSGLSFGSLTHGQQRGLYLRLTVDAGATPTDEITAGWAVEFSAA